MSLFEAIKHCVKCLCHALFGKPDQMEPVKEPIMEKDNDSESNHEGISSHSGQLTAGNGHAVTETQVGRPVSPGLRKLLFQFDFTKVWAWFVKNRGDAPERSAGLTDEIIRSSSDTPLANHLDSYVSDGAVSKRVTWDENIDDEDDDELHGMATLFDAKAPPWGNPASSSQPSPRQKNRSKKNARARARARLYVSDADSEAERMDLPAKKAGTHYANKSTPETALGPRKSPRGRGRHTNVNQLANSKKKKSLPAPLFAPSAIAKAPQGHGPQLQSAPNQNGVVTGPSTNLSLTVRNPKHIREMQLRMQLCQVFPEEISTISQNLIYANHGYTPAGLHVFIDFSNIWIGFMDGMKVVLGIPRQARLPATHKNICIESLIFSLERNRPVSKRVLLGSLPYRPAFEAAKRVGYETHILEKVRIRAAPATSNGGSGLDNTQHAMPSPVPASGAQPLPSPAVGGVPLAPSMPPQPAMVATDVDTEESTTTGRWREQAVDEILHLKIAESLLDFMPGTIVLASGDGNRSEFSEGFFKMVDRALWRGWKVELVAWKKSLSSVYKDRRWLNRWEGRFRIVELDQFLHVLLDS